MMLHNLITLLSTFSNINKKAKRLEICIDDKSDMFLCNIYILELFKTLHIKFMDMKWDGNL